MITARTAAALAAIAVTAGVSVTACGSTAKAPAKAPAATASATPAPAALPVASTGQTVTFSWPGSSPTGHATTWKMTVLGVSPLTSGPLSGQPAGYRDFCLNLKFTLTGPDTYAQFSGQFDPQWTWKGGNGQVIGGSDASPAFDSAGCQTAFPASEDISAAVTAPAPGQFVDGSVAFSVPAAAGMLWLDNGNGPAVIAGIRY